MNQNDLITESEVYSTLFPGVRKGNSAVVLLDDVKIMLMPFLILIGIVNFGTTSTNLSLWHVQSLNEKTCQRLLDVVGNQKINKVISSS